MVAKTHTRVTPASNKVPRSLGMVVSSHGMRGKGSVVNVGTTHSKLLWKALQAAQLMTCWLIVSLLATTDDFRPIIYSMISVDN